MTVIDVDTTSAAAILRGIRQQLGLSQSAAATRAGIPQSVWSLYENGKREPTFASLHAILQTFDVTVQLRAVRHMPAEFWAVRRFGMKFPQRDKAPLPDMKPLWDAVRERRERELARS